MHLIHRKSCRACGSSALEKVVDLGEQQIQGVFAKAGETPPLRKVPLALLRCDPTQDEKACGLLQAAVSVPPDILYHRYWYRSGTNRTMTEHLGGIARQVAALNPQSVLDIGCNDGTLLAALPDHIERVGIDPSDAVNDVPDGITVIKDRFPSANVEGSFDAVVSVAMFYDLEDPTAFVEAVREVLAPDGVWVFEQSYMPAMLDNTSYDTICHEHLEYYSLAVIESILARAGMRVFNIELNASNGGSIRCFATQRESHRSDSFELSRLRFSEFDRLLDTARPYRDFQEQVEAHRDSLGKLVRDLHREGKSIHVYGASTKGNTILQYCGLDSSIIDCAADRNPDKHGARTIGTDIPIVSEAESRAMRPDYYLVLPWHFRSEFVERERQTLDAGTKFIFPLPRIEVVGQQARKLHVA